MQVMKLTWIATAICLLPVCFTCVIEKADHGLLSRSPRDTYNRYSECWIITVPEGSYVTITIDNIMFQGKGGCSEAFLEVIESVTNKTMKFCDRIYPQTTFRALNNVKVDFYHNGNSDWYRKSSFTLRYFKESLICAREDNFRCSDHQCIRKNQVCDRVDDCDNGSDEIACERGIAAVEGAKSIRGTAVTWLMKKAVTYGWDKDTPRAIIALFLAEGDLEFGINKFVSELEEDLMVKQLELQTLLAILRNSTEAITVSELSMFVNALTVTCHNPRQFYGYDLVKILHERVSVYDMPRPAAYLTLCNSDWTLSESDVEYLFKLLQKDEAYPFFTDIQAMTIIALSCVRNKYEEYENLFNSSSIFNETIESFLNSQLPDGSFGNIYKTALITQALIASEQEPNKRWNATSTAKYFIDFFNSTAVDFLSVYLTLPALRSRSLANIGKVNCANSYRKQENDISDVKESLEQKIFIQYSLFIGDEGDIIHTIYLKMPNHSSAYDVMRVAQVTDPKYKFLHQVISGKIYVYQIADITNDPEAGKFWLLYTKDNEMKTAESYKGVHHKESPDKLILKDGEHLVMWYKTAALM